MVLFEAFAFWTVFAYLVEIAASKKARLFVNYVRKNLANATKYKPFVSVIVPFKGMDYNLKNNIDAIINQGYKNRELIFVYDNEDDSAYPILRKFKNVKLVKSKIMPACSGKAAALISGAEKSTGDVLLFADSDILPTKNWLGNLVGHLKENEVGATTSYRLYFPIENNFISCLKSSWNSSHIGVMTTKYSFVWGGSFAMERKLFEKLKIKEKWKTAISDDTVVTESVRKAGLKIRFIPKSLVASFDNSNMAELKEYSNRQMFFVRNFDRATWNQAFLIYGYFNLVWLTGIISLLLGFFNTRFFIPGALLILTQFFPLIRNHWRDKAIQSAVPEFKEYFSRFKWKRVAAELIVKSLTMYNILKSMRMKKIVWRGRVYNIHH